MKNVELKNGSFSRVNRDGVRWGVKLKDAVAHQEREPRLWPTPDVRGFTNQGALEKLKHSAKDREEFSRMAYRKGEKKKQKVWPTPTAQDSTGDSSTPRSAVSGCLNPTWVEWLMGFPLEWTVLKD